MAAANLTRTLLDQAPPLGFRFGVFFFAGGAIANPIDFRFRRVSGIAASIDTYTVEEGGQNLFSQRLPKKIQYDNLVLERGLLIGSPLTLEFNAAMSLFKFTPANVLVTLFNDAAVPVAGWLFIKAYPLKWSLSDLNADDNAITVETMELAFERMQVMRV
jgi:phage tail-like protein